MKKNGLICMAMVWAIFLTAQGCSLAPEYSRPVSPVEPAWPKGEAYLSSEAASDAALAAGTPWKTFFIDTRLQQVIDLALSNNRDLRVAALNMEKMKALYQIQRSEQFPSVNGNAGATARRIPESLSSTGRSMMTREYSMNVGVSAYELDFFGRVKNLKDKALESYLATEQARVSAQISLVSEVAGAWLNLAADQDRLRLARDTLTAQQASYDVIRRRFELGASSELALRQAQTPVESARLDIARYTRLVAQDRNALEFLTGCTVPSTLLPESLHAFTEETPVMGPLSAGLSSEVLLNRPDILASEMRLKAANADIGAARAAFFPRITLTGAFGFASDDLTNLFREGVAWSFIPSLSVPIFNMGRTQANLEAARVEREISVANYEKAIQAAFREVADALAQRGTVGDQLTAQKALLEATAEAYRLSDVRYKKGIDSFLTVLDAQRSWYAAQQAMINVRLLKLASHLTLYKVLGGGGA